MGRHGPVRLCSACIQHLGWVVFGVVRAPRQLKSRGHTDGALPSLQVWWKTARSFFWPATSLTAKQVLPPLIGEPISVSPMQDTAVYAAAVLKSGGLVAYPTEAVWGLGCDPWNQVSVERLLALKQRDRAKGLILVAAGGEQLEPWLRVLDADQRKRVCTIAAHPTTWLIPDPAEAAPAWIRGEHTGVAVRISEHPGVVALCRAFGGPLVSTSANPSGSPAARNRLAVQQYFGAAVDCYLPGEVGSAAGPSIIRDLISGKVLRDAGG